MLIFQYKQGVQLEPVVLNSADLGSGQSLSNGDLTLNTQPLATIHTIRSTATPKTSGKYYFEMTINVAPADGQIANVHIGGTNADPFTPINALPSQSGYVARYSYNSISDTVYFQLLEPGFGTLETITEATGVTNIRSYITGKTFGFMLNLDDHEVSVTNGTSTTSAYTIPTGNPWYPAIKTGASSTGVVNQLTTNFGETAYVHGLPVGYSNWT
jgi:hypothetical protein